MPTPVTWTLTGTAELPEEYALDGHEHPLPEHTHPLEAHGHELPVHAHDYAAPQHTHPLEAHTHDYAAPDHTHPYEIPNVILPRTHILLAAYDSRNKAAADHICDGTADDADMNNAIADLGAGASKIEVAAGTYRLANTVLMSKPSVVFEGHGRGTVLEPINAFPNNAPMLKVYDDNNTTLGCVVKHLRLSGANTTFANPLVHGLWMTSEVGIVDDVRIWQMSGDGLWIRNNVVDNNVSKTRFTKMDIAACGRHGIWAICGDNHFSDSIIRANADSNLYGSMAGCQWINCHFFGSTENKAGTQTLYDMHIFATERCYFTNCKFEHARYSPVWLDANPSGGKVVFVNCPVRDGSGEGPGLHPQLKITRAGGSWWNVEWCMSRFDADHGKPSWNIEIDDGAVRNGRFVANTYADATVGTVTPFTAGITGKGYRSTNEALGFNMGDPNSTGDWFGAGRAGIEVWDGVNSKLWKCRVASTPAVPAGVWVALN